MKDTFYKGRAYDYQSPKLGKLNIFYQSLINENSDLNSSVHIVSAVDEQRLLEINNSERSEIEKLILSIAKFSYGDKNKLYLNWIETQEKARGNRLAALALRLGLKQAELADSTALHSLFYLEEPGWNSRVDFFNGLGFDNVPQKDSYRISGVPPMSFETAKLKHINLDMVKPNNQLTQCMMEQGKIIF